MRPVANACPPDEALIAYGLGKATDAGLEGIATHVNGCTTCVNRLASLSADSFVGKVQKGGTAFPRKSLSGLVENPSSERKPIPVNLLPAELLGLTQYSEMSELGRGGMGIVYLAKNQLLDRREVLKVVGPQHMSRPGAKERFLQEVRAAARLHHPNVVTAYAVMEADTSLVFAMEYVPGENLADVVRGNGAIGVSFACGYAAQVALGLQHGFEEGMVHRDIKPGNLMLSRKGNKVMVKILDFGLAKVASETGSDTGLTGDGRMMGTPDFMAPEQGRDAARADIRADIYSLGCTLYYLLTGRAPFHGATLTEVLLKHAQDEAVSLNLVRPEVPVEIAAVVSRMMAKDPRKRYQTPAEVALALKPFMKSGPSVVKAGTELSQAGETARPVQTASTATPPAESPGVAPALPGIAPTPRTEAPVAVGAAWASLVGDKPTAPIAPPFTLVTPVGPLDFETPQQQSRSKKNIRKKPKVVRWNRKSISIAAVVALAVFGSLAWLSTVIFRVETPTGALVVEMNDADVEAKIKGGKVVLTGPDGKELYSLSPSERDKKLKTGEYKIRVEGADGLTLDTPEFTLKKGDKVTVRISLDKKDIAKVEPKKEELTAVDPDRNAAEYVLSIGGVIRVNDEINDSRALDELPSKPFRLTYIELGRNRKLRNAELVAFEGCKHLKYLSLYDTQVKDIGLTYFKECVDLETLELGSTPISDLGLANFKDCTKLKRIGLNYVQITEKGLANFSGCKDVKSLSLFAVPLTDNGLSHFKDCIDLENLELVGAQVTDAGLENLKKCKKLVSISLEGANFVTDKGMVYLKDCHDLTGLILSHTQVGDEGLTNFKDCKKLRRLGLNNTQVTDKGLAYFKGCEDLQELGQGRTKVTKEGVADFQKALPKCRIDIQPNQVINPDTPESPAAPKQNDFVSLFNGKDLSGWTTPNGALPEWTVRDGNIEVNPVKPDIQTKEYFGPDFKLHAEFWVPLMADKKGQARANSGIFLHGRYEIQILDSYMNDTIPAGEVGAMYRVLATDPTALKRAIRKPETWNTYDITFHAPRIDNKGVVTVPGRITIALNDVTIINDAKFDKVSAGSMDNLIGSPGPIRLQNHGDKIRFRNIEIKELPSEKSAEPKLPPKSSTFVPMFNGKDLTGWKGLPDMWTTRNGIIIGSSVQNSIKFNTCLCTEKTYDDFELKCQLKLIGGAKANSGIQIRSKLFDAEKFIVEGPQCDAGAGYWGSLYGEGSGGMMQAADPAVVAEALKPGKFNELYIRCVGSRVTIKLNGMTTVDKQFSGLPASGIIGLQLHGGDAQMVEFKDIQIKELPAKNALPLDPFHEKSVWKSIDRKLVFAVTERKGETFKARWVVGTSVQDVSGTVKDGKFSWLAKDVKAMNGGAKGDYFGTVVNDQDGDRIDIKWQLGNQSGEFVLRKQPGK